MRRGRFYALRVFNGGYSTVGGIKINGRGEVIDSDGMAIPGLYAGGDCAAGELYGDPPIGGIGNASIAMAQGFACADSVLEQIGK